MERYKDPIEELIQVPCEKVEKEETSYQAVCKETREETELHTALKYFTKDDRFNCDLYTTNITTTVDRTREKWTMGPIQMGKMEHVSRSKGANSIPHHLQKRNMKCSLTEGQNAT